MKKGMLFINLLLALVLVFQFTAFANSIDLTTDTTYQKEGTDFLSLNKPVTISSNYNSGSGSWKTSGLNDGKVGTDYPYGWTTDPNDPEANADKEAWVQIDLEDVYGIERIVLWPRQDKNPPEGYPIDFTLEISVDGENWTVVATETGQTDVTPDAKIFDIDTVNGRYVRMHCTKRNAAGSQYVVQLAEMAVYGGEPVTSSPETFDSSISIFLIVFVVVVAASFYRNKSYN